MAIVIHVENLRTMKSVFKRAEFFFLRLQEVKTIKPSFCNDLVQILQRRDLRDLRRQLSHLFQNSIDQFCSKEEIQFAY